MNQKAQRNHAHHGVRAETDSFGMNPHADRSYDRIVQVGTFFIDPLPAVGLDGAKFTVKAPDGERKRVSTLKAAQESISAKVMALCLTVKGLTKDDSALVVWRVKNFA